MCNFQRRLVTYLAIILIVLGFTKLANVDDCGFDNNNGPKNLGTDADHIMNRLNNIYYNRHQLDELDELSPEARNDRNTLFSQATDIGKLQAQRLNSTEIKSLVKIFGRKKDCEKIPVLDAKYKQLANLAYSSTNKENVPNFIIGKYGRFFENHHDIDNDGIDNHLDLIPFVETENDNLADYDKDGDGIPDHLDWDLTRGNYQNQDNDLLQECLYDRRNCEGDRKQGRNHNLLLIDNEVWFTDSTLKSIEDVLYKVFDDCNLDNPYCNNKESAFRSVVKVYASGSPHIEGENLNNSNRNAEVLPGSRTMYLYDDINNDLGKWNHLQRFIVLSHEFLHALQYSFDYPEMQKKMRKEYVYKTPKFEAYINHNFGGILKTDYQTRFDNPKNRSYHNLFLNEQDEVPSAYITEFGGEKVTYKKKKIREASDDEYYDCIFNAENDCDKRADQKDAELYSEHGIVRYLNNSIFELHAHLFEAYLIRSITSHYVSKYIKQLKDTKESERRIYQCMRKSKVFDFRFPENLNKNVMEHFKESFPLTTIELDELVDRYFNFEYSKFDSGGDEDWCK